MPTLSSILTSRRLIPAAVALLLLTSMLPSRFAGVVGDMGAVARFCIAPISNPLRDLAVWLLPARRGEAPPDEIALLQQERDHAQTLYLQKVRENERLRARIAELERGFAMSAGGFAQVTTTVVAASSDLSSRLLTARAGRAAGVREGAVAVVEAVQLVGKVTRIDGRTSQVLPITARDAGSLRARIMVGGIDDADAGLACLLRPTGEGTLRGDVADLPEGEPDTLAIDQIVRLSDSTWPAHADMLVLGRVIAIERAPEAPLRRVVVVRPTLDLARVSEVVIRTPVETEDDG